MKPAPAEIPLACLRDSSRAEEKKINDQLWSDGWYRHARRLPSSNCGSRPPGASVELIVLHSISLPPGCYGGDAVHRLFTNSLDCDAHPSFQSLRGVQVSVHWLIARDGALWQYVSADHRAWHAGASRYLERDNCNDFSVGIELEGLEGDAFEAPQYETLASLCAALAGRYPVRAIAGHEHIAPGRKRDPGPGFDWLLLQRMLSWPAGMFPSMRAER
ncbi:MAG: 1,6-anhydro-N-acetylmuramyl-L-alanine amidase AmpD [Burkholderiaceae bacterium]|nr:1,6-anhydro-N-acetylmuramyl-L-alanine amidase AmpD [Burkholderiaceae bacterium]